MRHGWKAGGADESGLSMSATVELKVPEAPPTSSTCVKRLPDSGFYAVRPGVEERCSIAAPQHPTGPTSQPADQPAAVLLLGHNCELLMANDVARNLVVERRGLCLSMGKRIVPTAADQRTRFAQLIDRELSRNHGASSTWVTLPVEGKQEIKVLLGPGPTTLGRKTVLVTVPLIKAS